MSYLSLESMNITIKHITLHEHNIIIDVYGIKCTMVVLYALIFKPR